MRAKTSFHAVFFTVRATAAHSNPRERPFNFHFGLQRSNHERRGNVLECASVLALLCARCVRDKCKNGGAPNSKTLPRPRAVPSAGEPFFCAFLLAPSKPRRLL